MKPNCQLWTIFYHNFAIKLFCYQLSSSDVFLLTCKIPQIFVKLDFYYYYRKSDFEQILSTPCALNSEEFSMQKKVIGKMFNVNKC